MNRRTGNCATKITTTKMVAPFAIALCSASTIAFAQGKLPAPPPGSVSCLEGQYVQGVNFQTRTVTCAALPDQSGAVAALQEKLSCMSKTDDNVYFTNCNVHVERGNLHVVNGAGSTQTINSFGNLIVGYNENATVYGRPGSDRTGSHNLIVGDGHSYSRYSGIVTGQINKITAPYANVYGGIENEASEPYATVLTGDSNKATARASIVITGIGQTASGYWSSVIGGQYNTASGWYSSVGGGENNFAEGISSSVSGGKHNRASGDGSSVSGGWENIASGSQSGVSGGQQNTASGNRSSVSGGLLHTVTGEYDWAAGELFQDQ